jgi:drug/metabolite transporter (DMT)-like permease
MHPILALIIANVIWGAASPIFKLSLTNIPPFTLGFIRFFFASFLFLPWVFKYGFKGWTKKNWVLATISAFFGILVNIGCYFVGLPFTESINAPVIGSTSPLFLFLFAVIFLHEKPSKRVLLGMFLSFIGVLIIVFSPIFNGKSIGGMGDVKGNLLFVVAIIGYLVSTVISKPELKKLNPIIFTFVCFIFGSLMFVPMMVFELQSWNFSQLTWVGMLGIVFGIFFSSALAYYLFNYGLSKISAQEVGVFSYVDPVVAVLLAIPLLHEYPNLYFFLGSLLVFGGFYLSEGRIHYHPFHLLKHIPFSHLFAYEKTKK